MKPVSFRGFALNGSGLSAAFDRAYQRPALSPVSVSRQGRAPKVTAVEQELWQLPALGMLIDGNAADDDALRLGLLRAFDTRAGAGALVVADDDGNNERYLYAVCQNLEQEQGKAGLGFAATLVAADEPFWLSVDATTVTEAINVSGETFVVANPGDVDVEPVVTVLATAGRTGTGHWRYRRFVPVFWRSPAAARDYQYELSDGAGLNTSTLLGSKLTDETGFGVIVDGVEIDRWFGAAYSVAGGFASTTTKVWCNLDFRPALAATLAAAIAGSGPVSEILINEDVSAWPASGIVSIGGERFLYNGRDFYRRAFTGVSRAAYNSGASAHAVGDTVDWLQHEVWVVYTPGLNVAKATDDGRKPLLKLPESSNATWVWEEFGSAAAPERTAQWTPVVNGTATIFTGDQNGAATDPYAVMGIAKPAAGANLVENLGRWQTYLPCGLSGYTVDGADYENSLTVIEVSSDGTAWQEADLSPTGTGWEDWTETATGLSAALRYLAVRMRQVGAASDVLSQVEKVTATLQTGLRPTGNIGVSEQSNYQLEMTITNETTDEAFSLSPLPGLVVVSTESVEVDTEAKTATLMPLGANVYSALRRDALRLSMLRLQPGNNTIRVEETGIAGVTVTVSFRPRWYA